MTMFKTIKSKFVTTVIFIIIVTIIPPLLFLYHQYENNFEQRSLAMLRTTQEVIRESLNHAMLNPLKEIQPLLEQIGRLKYIKRVRIIDDTGIIHYSSDSTEINKPITSVSEDHKILDSNQDIHVIESNTVYSQALPIKNDKKCQSCHKQKDIIAYLDVDSELTHAETFFYVGYRHTLFLGIAVIIFLIGGLYIFFETTIHKPLQKVMLGLDDIEKGNLNTSIPVTGNDEFAKLNQHFNSMAGHLAQSRAEIKTLHNEQLQRADKLVTLGEIAAEMAHEINNPAGVILTRADYLLLEASDNAALRPYENDFETIMKQTERVARITGNILKYSKKLPKNFTQFDLSKCVAESMGILEPRLRRRHISLQQSYSCQAHCSAPVIFGDAQQIEQIVINLVNNAIDAMEKDGHLKINVSCITENRHQLIVEDDGPGIDEQTREKIFMPFFTTKNSQKGTGLGLYIVKNICNNHNAEITCESSVGQGTKFKIIFNG